MKCLLAIAGVILATGLGVAEEDQPFDPYDGLFVSDLAVCERAAATDLSDALFTLNATALIPYEELIATELRCEFTGVEPEPAQGGFELFANATCTTVTGSYDDFFWISANGDVGGSYGETVSLNSQHADDELGEAHFIPYYRCENLDPVTVKR